MTSPSTLWLRRFHPAAGRPVRLVCFPHAGGSASYYHPVSAALSADTEVIALQYPGRQDRRTEPCLDSIDALADRITDELLTLEDRPTLYFGHSMGAVLAFETAWRLEQKGGPAPRGIIASGRRAPSTRRAETVHQRDDAGVLAELRLLDGTNTRALENEEILRMSMPAIRADYRAVERYTCEPGRVLRCPITALTGDADPRTTVAEAEAWQEHTSGGFRLRVLPGGHFFLAEQQAAVLREITTELAELR
ncbi:thioesterase II family protein [Kitasatospora aureofaciens]|uniref:thioesterase II family protein n=1 Tax=Kitasatospora aureofaciens TaxID=1894 RepID=UPI000526D4B5|nr:alpha/beta fold hydrolase [Kitasatospora aureofaciens]